MYVCDYNAILVTGEANVSMDITSLTIDGFNQPAVAHRVTRKCRKGTQSEVFMVVPQANTWKV